MEIIKREFEILENNFRIYEATEDYELEAWTDGGVDMLIYIDKFKEENVIEQLEHYLEEFDIDEIIDLHRQDEDYRNDFKITESVKDFENWVHFIEEIIKELKENLKD